MSINFYIYDCESTGLKAGFNEINQISIIRCSDGAQKTFKICVEHPERASKEVLDIQGITRSDLKKGIKPKEAVDELNAFVEQDGLNPESRCIIGHNVAFDRRFAHALWETQKKRFPADLWLCTKKFYKSYVTKVGEQVVMQKQAQVLPGEKKVKYGQDLCLIGAGLQPKSGAHTAEGDAVNCFALWQFLLDQKLNYVRMVEQHPHKVVSNEPEFFDF